MMVWVLNDWCKIEYDEVHASSFYTNPYTYVSVLRRCRACARFGVGGASGSGGGGGVGDVNCGDVVWQLLKHTT